jgi:polyhydroxyalkanoate synthase
LLLVHSLVSRSYVLDLQPGNSFIEHLLSAGFDVFLVDWLPADERHAASARGLRRRLPARRGRADAARLGLGHGQPLRLLLRRVLTLLYAAGHPDAPLRSLTCMATPVDFAHWGVWKELAAEGPRGPGHDPRRERQHLGRPMRQSFRLLKPTGELRQYATLLTTSGTTSTSRPTRR